MSRVPVPFPLNFFKKLYKDRAPRQTRSRTVSHHSTRGSKVQRYKLIKLHRNNPLCDNFFFRTHVGRPAVGAAADVRCAAGAARDGRALRQAEPVDLLPRLRCVPRRGPLHQVLGGGGGGSAAARARLLAPRSRLVLTYSRASSARSRVPTTALRFCRRQ